MDGQLAACARGNLSQQDVPAQPPPLSHHRPDSLLFLQVEKVCENERGGGGGEGGGERERGKGEREREQRQADSN